MLVKLNASNGTLVLVESTQILDVFVLDECNDFGGKTRIRYVGTDNAYQTVNESPAEIYAMLESGI